MATAILRPSVDRGPESRTGRVVRRPASAIGLASALILVVTVGGGCDGIGGDPVVPGPRAALAATPPVTSSPPASTPVGPASHAAASTDADADAAPKSLATRPGVDWPTFLGPTGDSLSPETGIRTDWSGGLPVVWTAELGETYGTVAVAAGRCVYADRIGDELRLRCVHAETGAELWQWKTPMVYSDMYGFDGGPRSSPVIDGGRVYLHNVDGKLSCVALADGKPLWQRDLSADFHVVTNFFGVGSSPVVHGEKLLVMVGGSPKSQQSLPAGALDEVTPAGSAVVALDKRTGETVWSGGDELASYAALRVAMIEGEEHCLAFCRGGLLDLRPDTGAVRWHFPWRAKKFESVNVATPVVVGDNVFLTETYGPGAVRLDLGSGKPSVVWSDADRGRGQALLCHMNTPIYRDGYLYGSSGRHTGDAELRCVAWEDGEVAWSEPGLTRSSLLAVDGHFVLLTETGELRLIAIDPKAYREVAAWTPTGSTGAGGTAEKLLAYPAWSAPVLSRGLLYVAGAGRLVCLELIPAGSDPS